MNESDASKNINFIEDIIQNDLECEKHSKIMTRFPPEPNGYLHIGHAKSICLNFGLAKKYDGVCHLRFDDTNPAKEEIEYVDSIQEDVKWLGFDWYDKMFYASNYFEKFYEYALQLIKQGDAYVCSLNPDETREYRGTLTEPGKNSPYRDRSVEENLDLFERMKKGEFEEGQHVLRAKIDMSSPNINMRDPAIYRIKKASHHRTGDNWCIYPMYDFAHSLSDMIEGITHSICTLEFEDHRPLYDWILDVLKTPCHPRQIEFARLEMTNVVLSKRKLLKLVQEGQVDGWDDPRMPTLSGLRRRGFTPESIRVFCEKIGVSKSNSTVDIALLEHCLRDHLNKTAMRVMCVVDPLKIVITNYPDHEEEFLEAVNNQEDDSMGKREIPFSKEIYIEKSDFMLDPPKKYFRLSPGKEVRLMHAYYVTCQDVIKDENGEVIELHCTYDPESKGGWSQDGRKVKGTLHWVSAKHALDIEIHELDYLFKETESLENEQSKFEFNEDSLKVIGGVKAEPSLKNASPLEKYQFLRQGYYCLDSIQSKDSSLVFNKTVSLKDSWGKKAKK